MEPPNKRKERAWDATHDKLITALEALKPSKSTLYKPSLSNSQWIKHLSQIRKSQQAIEHKLAKKQKRLEKTAQELFEKDTEKVITQISSDQSEASYLLKVRDQRENLDDEAKRCHKRSFECFKKVWGFEGIDLEAQRRVMKRARDQPRI